MTLLVCKKCNGSMYTRDGLDGKETVCLTCGHEPVTIAQDILAEVEASYGKSSLRGTKPKFNVGIRNGRREMFET